MSVRGLDGGERCALLISECQQAMLDDALHSPRDELARAAAGIGLVPAIAELAHAFRRADQPVVHSHLVPRRGWRGFRVNSALAGVLKRTGALVEGSPGVDAQPGLEPEAGDFWVRRPTGMTSFYGTEIDALLRAEGVETVVVTGVSTNMAVFGSVLEAVNRGYNVVVPTDCVAGVGESQHVVARDLLPLLATMTVRREVIAVLDGRPGARA